MLFLDVQPNVESTPQAAPNSAEIDSIFARIQEAIHNFFGTLGPAMQALAVSFGVIGIITIIIVVIKSFRGGETWMSALLKGAIVFAGFGMISVAFSMVEPLMAHVLGLAFGDKGQESLISKVTKVYTDIWRIGWSFMRNPIAVIYWIAVSIIAALALILTIIKIAVNSTILSLKLITMPVVYGTIMFGNYKTALDWTLRAIRDYAQLLVVLICLSFLTVVSEEVKKMNYISYEHPNLATIEEAAPRVKALASKQLAELVRVCPELSGNRNTSKSGSASDEIFTSEDEPVVCGGKDFEKEQQRYKTLQDIVNDPVESIKQGKHYDAILLSRKEATNGFDESTETLGNACSSGVSGGYATNQQCDELRGRRPIELNPGWFEQLLIGLQFAIIFVIGGAIVFIAGRVTDALFVGVYGSAEDHGSKVGKQAARGVMAISLQGIKGIGSTAGKGVGAFKT